MFIDEVDIILVVDVDIVKDVLVLVVFYEKEKKECRYFKGINYIRGFFFKVGYYIKDMFIYFG